MSCKEEIIHKAIKDGLNTEIHEYAKEKDRNYCIITPEEWIELLGTIEAMYDRGLSTSEA